MQKVGDGCGELFNLAEPVEAIVVGVRCNESDWLFEQTVYRGKPVAHGVEAIEAAEQPCQRRLGGFHPLGDQVSRCRFVAVRGRGNVDGNAMIQRGCTSRAGILSSPGGTTPFNPLPFGVGRQPRCGLQG